MVNSSREFVKKLTAKLLQISRENLAAKTLTLAAKSYIMRTLALFLVAGCEVAFFGELALFNYLASGVGTSSFLSTWLRRHNVRFRG